MDGLSQIKYLIDNAIARNIENNTFFKEEYEELCLLCNKPFSVVPARSWGRDIGGYFMHEKHDHDRGTKKELSTERQVRCDFVVFINYVPCFITREERDRLVESYLKGVKLTKIRDYVIPLGSAIIPFEEYEQNELRKNRHVESQTLPF